MATHSSILAWEIHGETSLAGYNPRGLQRVGSELATKQPHSWCRIFVIQSLSGL